jgi:hypothetical protein
LTASARLPRTRSRRPAPGAAARAAGAGRAMPPPGQRTRPRRRRAWRRSPNGFATGFPSAPTTPRSRGMPLSDLRKQHAAGHEQRLAV